MLNQIVIVGRLAQEIEDNILVLAVQRIFKNEDGIYETDIVPITLNGAVAENTKEYCKKGDIVGVKGRIQSNDKGIEIIGEKVTFLSSYKGE